MNSIITNAANKEEVQQCTPPLLCRTATPSQSTNQKNLQAATCTTITNNAANRSQRLFLRNRVPANDPTLKGVKEVKLNVEGGEYNIDIEKKAQSEGEIHQHLE